jgi:hypothetical protein
MNIQDTGVRGYLKWLKSDQPGLYATVAPIIAQRVPEAFSDREQSIAQAALMGLADDAAAPDSTPFYIGISPYSPDDQSMSSASAVQDGGDVASAANTGAASSGIMGAIANIVNSVAQYKLTSQQNDIFKQVNAQQAQAVGAGNPPLAIRTTSLGIPFISGPAAKAGVTLSGAAVAVATVVGLLLFLGRRGRA